MSCRFLALRNKLDQCGKAARRLLLTTALAAPGLTSALAAVQETPAEPKGAVQDVDALDLDALIAELDPPSIDKILKWFGPATSAQLALEPLPADPNAIHHRRAPAAQEERISLLGDELDHRYGSGQFSEAIEPLEEIVRIYSDCLGAEHWSTIEARDDLRVIRFITTLPTAAQSELGQTFSWAKSAYELPISRQGPEAPPILMRVVATRRKWLDERNGHVAASLHNLAYGLYHASKWNESEALFRKSVSIRIQIYGTDHPRVGLTLRGLGHILLQNGRSDAAARCYAEAIMIYRRAYGDDHSRVRKVVLNLARALLSEGEFAAAERAFRDEIELRKSESGDRSEPVAAVLLHLGRALREQGRYADAAVVLRACVGIRRQVFGQSLELAHALHTWGTALLGSGDLVGAERALSAALAIRRARIGVRHHDVTANIGNLAAVLMKLGEHAAAEALFRECLTIDQSLFGMSHQRTATTRHNLSVVLYQQQMNEEAEFQCREALRIRRVALGDGDTSFALTSNLLAAIAHARGELDQAVSLVREALQVARKNAATKPGLMVRLRVTLAGYLIEQDPVAHFDEADELLREAVEQSGQLQTGNQHLAFTARARFLQKHGDSPGLAAALYRQAISLAEDARVRGQGDELDRSRQFSTVRKDDPYGGLLRLLVTSPESGSAASAFDVLERGRGRAILDLLDRSAVDLTEIAKAQALRAGNESVARKLDDIRKREVTARGERSSAEARLRSLRRKSAAGGDGDAIALQNALRTRDEAAVAERRAMSDLLQIARKQLGSRGLSPMTAMQIAKSLSPNELLLAYDVGPMDSIALAIDSSGDVSTHVLKWPDGREVSADSLGGAVAKYVAQLSFASESSHEAPGLSVSYSPSDIGRAVLPDELLDRVSAASRIIMVADGPLHQLPFEALAVSDNNMPFWIDTVASTVYGPSATVISIKRSWAERRKRSGTEQRIALVAGGASVFSRELPIAADDGRVPDPTHGVLLASVAPDSNALNSGLRDGDVILSYGGRKLYQPDNLGPAIRRAEEGSEVDGAADTPAADDRASDPALRGPSERDLKSQIANADSETRTQSAATQKSNGGIPVTVWRDGKTITLSVAPGKLGVRTSRALMPTALNDWRELQLSEDERYVKYASATTRGGFGELKPLPGTGFEVRAIADVVRKSGVKPEAIKVLTGEDATLTNLFEAADSPRFLHLATHGLIHGGRKVYESALALTVPKVPTPDDFGFLRLQDLLYKWGGKLEGTELVVLSGCQTAKGRLEAADGFVGLTWGFLYAGADSVIASLWKVDDAATTLLMKRLYENLLGTYDEPRWKFAAGAEMPKAEALHEAKRWLKSRTPKQNRDMLAKLGFDVKGLGANYRAERGGRQPSQNPQPLADPFDYSHPRYWAAFILIGDPG